MKDLATQAYIAYLHDLLLKHTEASALKDNLIAILERQNQQMLETIRSLANTSTNETVSSKQNESNV